MYFQNLIFIFIFQVTIRASLTGTPMSSDSSSKAYIVPTSPETTKYSSRTTAKTAKSTLNGGKTKQSTSQIPLNRTIHNNELKRLKWVCLFVCATCWTASNFLQRYINKNIFTQTSRRKIYMCRVSHCGCESFHSLPINTQVHRMQVQNKLPESIWAAHDQVQYEENINELTEVKWVD